MNAMVTGQKIRNENFFVLLEDIKNKVSSHRKKFFKKSTSLKIDNIYKLISELEELKDEIARLKDNCYYLKDSLDEYLKPEEDYISLMSDTLKILTKNINDGVNVDSKGNDLLFSTSKMSYCSSKMDNMVIRTLTKDDCLLIDKKYIPKDKSYYYSDLNKKQEFYKEQRTNIIENLGRSDDKSKEYVKIDVFNRDNIEEFYKKRDELIKFYEAKPGRKKFFLIDDISVYLPENHENGFLKEYKMLKKQYKVNNLALPNSKIIQDNIVCVGKIDGESLNYENTSYRGRDEKIKCIGKITVEDGDKSTNDGKSSSDDIVVYNTGREKKNTMHHKKSRFNILDNRKPINSKKLKKGIIMSSIALVMSLVTAVTSYGISKSLKDSVDNIFDSNVVNLKDSISDSNFVKVINSNSNSIIESDIVSEKVTIDETKEDLQREKNIGNNKNVDNLLDSKDDDFNIDVKIEDLELHQMVTVSVGSKIYTNCLDANNKTNGLNPYYSYDEEREINSFGLDYEGTMIYSDSEEEINYWTEKGAKKTTVCTTLNGGGEGFYNIDDVVIVDNKILTKTI